MTKRLQRVGLMGASSVLVFCSSAENIDSNIHDSNIRIMPADDRAEISGPSLTVFKRSPEVVALEAKMGPYLAQAALDFLKIPEPARTMQYDKSMVIASRERDCAVEFVVNPTATTTLEFMPGIFSLKSNMVDIEKINGDEMFDGTFGHGDEALASVRGDGAYAQFNLEHSEALPALAYYLTDATLTLCTIFESHINDPNGGYPDRP